MHFTSLQLLPVYLRCPFPVSNKTLFWWEKLRVCVPLCRCVICMMDFVYGDPIRFLPCMHIYPMDCIDDWLMRSFTCPSCMEPVDAALLSSLCFFYCHALLTVQCHFQSKFYPLMETSVIRSRRRSFKSRCIFKKNLKTHLYFKNMSNIYKLLNIIWKSIIQSVILNWIVNRPFFTSMHIQQHSFSVLMYWVLEGKRHVWCLLYSRLTFAKQILLTNVQLILKNVRFWNKLNLISSQNF